VEGKRLTVFQRALGLLKSVYWKGTEAAIFGAVTAPSSLLETRCENVRDVMSRDATSSFADWLKGRRAGQKQAGQDSSGGGMKATQRRWGIASCDSCGRTILDGEEIGIFRHEDRVVGVCPLCEGRFLAQGFVRAA
jgi:hypothetical protein